MSAEVGSDSSAALAVSQRVGLGKVRRIQAQYPWTREGYAAKQFDLRKVKGEGNPADILTNGVTQEVLRRHVRAANVQVMGGSGLRWEFATCWRSSRS